MRYAIINAATNAWEFEGNDLDEIEARVVKLKALGMGLVVVEILQDHSN